MGSAKPALGIQRRIQAELARLGYRERHVRTLDKYRENRPGISYQNRSSAGCIMCINGQLDNTDGVFAPYRSFKMLEQRCREKRKTARSGRTIE